MNIASVCIAAVAAPLHRGLLVAVAAATLFLAIHNAMVQSDKDRKPADGAGAGAAATVLAPLFPKDEAAVNARLRREMQAIGADKRAGFEAGDEFRAGGPRDRAGGGSAESPLLSQQSLVHLRLDGPRARC